MCEAFRAGSKSIHNWVTSPASLAHQGDRGRKPMAKNRRSNAGIGPTSDARQLRQVKEAATELMTPPACPAEKAGAPRGQAHLGYMDARLSDLGPRSGKIARPADQAPTCRTTFFQLLKLYPQPVRMQGSGRRGNICPWSGDCREDPRWILRDGISAR